MQSKSDHRLSAPVVYRSRSGSHPGVSLKTLRKWLEAGLLPHTRLGPAARLIRIRAEDIETFLRSSGQAPPQSYDKSKDTTHSD